MNEELQSTNDELQNINDQLRTSTRRAGRGQRLQNEAVLTSSAGSAWRC